MHDHDRADRDGADTLVTALLREEYAAPRDAAYWSALARSIVARAEAAQRGTIALGKTATSTPWLSGFAEWRQAGMVAAVAAIMAYAYSVIEQRASTDPTLSLVAVRSVLDGASTADSGHATEPAIAAVLSGAP
jgi:anti-sigma-K factor RskA